MKTYSFADALKYIKNGDLLEEVNGNVDTMIMDDGDIVFEDDRNLYVSMDSDVLKGEYRIVKNPIKVSEAFVLLEQGKPVKCVYTEFGKEDEPIELVIIPHERYIVNKMKKNGKTIYVDQHNFNSSVFNRGKWYEMEETE